MYGRRQRGVNRKGCALPDPLSPGQRGTVPGSAGWAKAARRAGALSALGLLLFPPPAQALVERWQLLAGGRAGAILWPADGLGSGVTGGVDLCISPHRLVGLELGLAEDRRWLEQPLSLSTASLSLQYRLDAGPVVPYGAAGAEVSWLRAAGQAGVRPPVAFFALGILAEFGERWYWGLEARYPTLPSGAFPARQLFALRLGFRSGPF
jgi:hypothetical protein